VPPSALSYWDGGDVQTSTMCPSLSRSLNRSPCRPGPIVLPPRPSPLLYLRDRLRDQVLPLLPLADRVVAHFVSVCQITERKAVIVLDCDIGQGRWSPVVQVRDQGPVGKDLEMQKFPACRELLPMELAGLEPATSWVRSRRSINLDR
jgi:hypothetical protein